VSRATMADLIIETMKEEGTLKEHKFAVIRWLGERADPERFGVVEIDEAGPILRSGPFDRTEAEREATALHNRTNYTSIRRHKS
jgi:hypothetical protein